jgi:DNA helicase HerA-like ATPase
MTEEYIRVTPSSESYSPRNIPDLLATLHKLWLDGSGSKLKGFFGAFVPFHSTQPPQPTFEMVIYSSGGGEPVEFYYGCDTDLLDTLENRLRTLYPSTFEIERVTTDLTRKLIHPVEYDYDEFRERLNQGRLYWDASVTGSAGSEVSDTEQGVLYADEDDPTVSSYGSDTGEIEATVSGDADTHETVDQPTSADGGTTQTAQTAETTQASHPPRVIEHEEGVMTLDPPDAIPRTDSLTELERPALTQQGTVLARPDLDDESLTPFGTRWDAHTPHRKKDWMTSATTLADWTTQRRNDDDGDDTSEHEQTTAPNGEVIDHLVDAEEPTAAQFVFKPKASWENERSDRQYDIENQKDTLGQTIASGIAALLRSFTETGAASEGVREQRRQRRRHNRNTPHNRSGAHSRGSTGPKEGSKEDRRLDEIKAIRADKTYTVNMRTVGMKVANAAADGQSGAEAETETVPVNEGVTGGLDATLDGICSSLDILDGEFYEIEGSRIDTGRKAQKNARAALDRFINRDITTGRGDTRPDFVFTPSELASLFVVPSSESLSEKATRAVQAEQQSRSPVAGPRPELRPHYKDGMAVGDLPDTSGYTQPETMHLPATLMNTHWARFAQTGSGKSTGLATDALSTEENTAGPEIVIEPKDGDVIRNFMRSYAAKHGFDALEEDVLYFPVPEVLPGMTLFDARQSLAEDVSRTDIIQDLAERYIELIKLRMGTKSFDDAKNAGIVINYLIDALLDEEHGRTNGRYRASEDYFSHEQFQHVIDDVLNAIQVESVDALPESSTDQTTRSLRRYLKDDPSTAKNILRGVATRADTLARDPHIRALLENTTPNFDFREILDTDKIVLFDLSGLRKNPSKSMAATVLTMLYDALDDRNEWLNDQPEDYIVNLFVDEAHTVTVAETMNTLLEQGRGYQVGVGLYAQFAKQMEYEGGEQVYHNALNNITTRIVGPIPIDDKLAEALATEEMDATAVKNRLRAMPPGEWFTRFPSPEYFESPPRPFTVRSRPIPSGHAEGDDPLTGEDEQRFQETIARMAAQTDAEYGAEESPVSILTEAPLGVMDLLDLGSRDIDHVLVSLIQSAQMKANEEGANEAVDVSDVLDDLEECYEIAEGCSTEDMPGHEELVAIMERSRFLDIDTAEGETSSGDGETEEESEDDGDTSRQVKLTETAKRSSPVPTTSEAGIESADEDGSESSESNAEAESGEVETVFEAESESKPAVGTNRTSGGEEHSKALKRIDAALHANGWTMKTVDQDSRGLPDARAYHPDMGQVVHVEAEHTTPEVPMKVIQNYQKAIEKNALCLAVVEEKPDDPLHWARRVDNILSDPVKRRDDDGTVEFYTDSDEEFEFAGGGHIDGTVTAVRRVTDENDSRRSVWTRESLDDSEDEYVLRTSDGDEVTRIEAGMMADPRKSNFSGVYRYRRDSEQGSYIVYEGAAEHTYDSKETFTDEWVTVKQPFVPESDFNKLNGNTGGYVVVVLPADEADQPSVFTNGITVPLSELTSGKNSEESLTPSQNDGGKNTSGELSYDPSSSESLTQEESKERFIEECLFTTDDLESNPELEEAAIISNGDLVLPKSDAVEAFNAWQKEHLSEEQLPDKPKNASRFTRDILTPYADDRNIETETVRRTLAGDRLTCYKRFGLTKHGKNYIQ